METTNVIERRDALRGPVGWAVLVSAAFVYAAGRLLLPLTDPSAVDGWRLAAGLPVFMIGAVACFVRAERIERDRQAWRLLAAGLAIYPVGTVATELFGSEDSAPIAAHAAWLGFYACAYLALASLGRTAVRPFPLAFLLDGVVGALAAIATVTLAVEFIGALPYRLWEVVLGLAYPMLDVVLLAFVVWMARLGHSHDDALWRRLGIGFGVMLIADLAFIYAGLTESLDSRSLYTAGYPVAMAVIASAAWISPPAPTRLRVARARSLVLPGSAVAVSLIVIALQLAVGLRGPASAFALLALATFFVRGALVYRDLDAAREGRRYSEASLRVSRVALLEARPEDLLPQLVTEIGRALDSDGVVILLQRDGSEPDLSAAQVMCGPAVDAALWEALGQLKSPIDRALIEGRGAMIQAGDGADPALTAALLGAGQATLHVTPIEATLGPPAAICVVAPQSRRAFSDGDRQFLLTAANITASALDRTRREDDSRHRSLHDPLTGLANRALLTAHLEHAVEQGRRDDTQLGVVLFDLDRFKQVNDTLGHAVGDALLKEVATMLRATTRGGDLIARLGGDEFVVVFDKVDGVEQISPFVERLVTTLEQPVRIGDRDLFVGASVGVVAQPARAATPETLLRDADVAMYRAKAQGGGRHAIFDATLRAGVVQRASTEQHLRHAVERGEMRVAYQPQVSTDGSGVRGFEALVRWERPGIGLVPPAEFVHIAEESGLIDELGSWVLNEACAWVASVPAPRGKPLRIAVNLSARQITPELPSIVEAALGASGLPASRLCLEITETLLVADPVALEVLQHLRARGVTLALDDFGTGWSSLGALQRHAVDELKIDRSMIASIDSVAPARALARAVVDMAGVFGLTVVAEGVERPHQLDVIRELGCSTVQGFLFAPALSPSAAEEFLATRGWRAASATDGLDRRAV